MSDLAPYFAVTGCRPDGAPSAAALARLQLAHMLAFPFENLNPLSGTPVLLDVPALLEKFTRRRGGYCSENNLLYRAALETLGYATTVVIGRVRFNMDPGVVTPKSHVVLLVDVDGARYLSDTAFGKMTPSAPLRLVADVAQDTPHGRYRFVEHDGEWTLEADADGGWAPLYAFDLRPVYDADLMVANWYTSAHPDSHFTRELIAVRTAPDGRHVLRNTQGHDYTIVDAATNYDLSVSYQLTPNLRITLEGQNLTDEPLRYGRDTERNDTLLYVHSGRSAVLGLSYKF